MTDQVDGPSWGLTFFLFCLGIAIGVFAAVVLETPVMEVLP